PDEVDSVAVADLLGAAGSRGHGNCEAAAIAAAVAAGEPVEAACGASDRVLAVPLAADSETLGVLVVVAAAGARAFASSERAMVHAAADLLAAVLRSGRLH